MLICTVGLSLPFNDELNNQTIKVHNIIPSNSIRHTGCDDAKACDNTYKILLSILEQKNK